MTGQEREVLYYRLRSGESPFRGWREGLKDADTKAAIDARIARLRAGNPGDSKPIGAGASESRIDFGPGFRIYYGVSGSQIILLCGGDKGTQHRDIKRAKDFWLDYKERTRTREKNERV
jgi:putative addiction module killer protein